VPWSTTVLIQFMEEFHDGEDLAGVFQPTYVFYNNHYNSVVALFLLFSICVWRKTCLSTSSGLLYLFMLLVVGVRGLDL